jgi:hypothetical protein
VSVSSSSLVWDRLGQGRAVSRPLHTNSKHATAWREVGKRCAQRLGRLCRPCHSVRGMARLLLCRVGRKVRGHVDLPDLHTVWSRAFDSVPPLGLTQKESALLKAYRLSDKRGRDTLSEAAERMAKDWPRYTFVVPKENAGGGIRSGVDCCNPITNRSADNVAIDQP